MAKKDDMVETGRDWKQRGRAYSISWGIMGLVGKKDWSFIMNNTVAI